MTTIKTEIAAITSKLGIHVRTTTHPTQTAAAKAARRAIQSGQADSAAIWTSGQAIQFLGSGR